MHDAATRTRAAELRAEGRTWSQIARLLGVSRSALREWHDRDPSPPAAPGCPRCAGRDPGGSAYAALLGYYLGDGCISRHRRYYTLRVSCDARLPGIVSDVTRCLEVVHPARRVFHVDAPGAVVVQSGWVHWPCLFPQHGPGRKHERPIVLDDWQVDLVESHPAAFLRGLFHSDGCRSTNWTVRPVAGAAKRYEYPRWQFTNVSADIRELCCWALDLVDVAWRQSNAKTISVSRREAVARLDELIGPKT